MKPKSELEKIEQKVDDWVNEVSSIDKASQKKTNTNNQNDVLIKLTIPIPEALHKKIKSACVLSGDSMKERIISILEKNFDQ